MRPLKIFTLACLAVVALASGAAQARPVVYKLRTVLDGQLGSLSFKQAVTTITLYGDTRDVRGFVDADGHQIYVNRGGRATVAVTVSGQTTTATFKSGEIYARYDTTAGTAGFASALGIHYPVALGCGEEVNPAAYTKDCGRGYWGYAEWLPPPSNGDWENGARHGTLNGLADGASVPDDVTNMTTAAQNLPANLSQNTLLTGTMHACSSLYTLVDAVYGFVDTCNAVAPRGLKTSLGDLYLQDQRYSQPYGVWYNMGSMRVEIQQDE